MSAVQLNTETQLKAMQCGTCGVWHAIPQAMFDSCYQEGGFWHCPNGHSRGYSKGSIRAKLEEAEAALAKEQKRRQWAEQDRDAARADAKAADNRANGYKGQAAKLKNRISAGVCPCCTRSFENLARHMKTMHPELAQEAEGTNN